MDTLKLLEVKWLRLARAPPAAPAPLAEAAAAASFLRWCRWARASWIACTPTASLDANMACCGLTAAAGVVMVVVVVVDVDIACFSSPGEWSWPPFAA